MNEEIGYNILMALEHKNAHEPLPLEVPLGHIGWIAKRMKDADLPKGWQEVCKRMGTRTADSILTDLRALKLIKCGARHEKVANDPAYNGPSNGPDAKMVDPFYCDLRPDNAGCLHFGSLVVEGHDARTTLQDGMLLAYCLDVLELQELTATADSTSIAGIMEALKSMARSTDAAANKAYERAFKHVDRQTEVKRVTLNVIGQQESIADIVLRMRDKLVTLLEPALGPPSKGSNPRVLSETPLRTS